MEYQRSQNNQQDRDEQRNNFDLSSLVTPAISLTLKSVEFGAQVRAIKEIFNSPAHRSIVQAIESGVPGVTMTGPEHMLFDALVQEKAASLR